MSESMPDDRASRRSVTAALDGCADLGPFFAVRVTDQPTGDKLADLYADASAMRAAINAVGTALSLDEMRVAASTLQLELAARFWSVALGSVVNHGVLPDLRELRYVTDSAGKVSGLTLTEPAGWVVHSRESAVASLTEVVVDEQLRPLHTAIRTATRIATGLLWGNAVSGLVNAAWLAAADSQLDPQPLVHALTDHGPMATGARTTDTGGLQRSSCCLFYRVPGGGTCADCPIEKAGPTNPE